MLISEFLPLNNWRIFLWNYRCSWISITLLFRTYHKISFEFRTGRCFSENKGSVGFRSRFCFVHAVKFHLSLGLCNIFIWNYGGIWISVTLLLRTCHKISLELMSEQYFYEIMVAVACRSCFFFVHAITFHFIVCLGFPMVFQFWACDFIEAKFCIQQQHDT